MTNKFEYYCMRTPPNVTKIYNVRIGSCCNLEIDPHRAIGTTCQYCKYMRVDMGIRKKKLIVKPAEPVKQVELTDLDILDIIGETGLEI